MPVGSNDELVDKLRESGYIETDRVEEAFRNVDRYNFIPESYRESAYLDRPLPIADGEATISAPHMVAMNTELLDVEQEDRVLEIGSGSGYQLAILSELGKEAVGVDVIEELVEKSRERLSDRENVTVHHGNGFNPVEGKFDRILFSCAIDSIEKAEDHLEEDGVAVAPVNEGEGMGQVLKRLKNGEVEDRSHVQFVPFVEERN